LIGGDKACLVSIEYSKDLIMSFQAYLDNIQAKTGKSPNDFKRLAEKKGFTLRGKLKPDVKAGEIVNWLKDEFKLGHGHSMAIYALLKGMKKVGD